jgi:hypothetical protein
MPCNFSRDGEITYGKGQIQHNSRKATVDQANRRNVAPDGMILLLHIVNWVGTQTAESQIHTRTVSSMDKKTDNVSAPGLCTRFIRRLN